MSDYSFLFELEKLLHSPERGASSGELAKLLSPDFFEFGASGKVWSRTETLETFAAGSPGGKILSTDYQATKLSEGIVLVTYVSTRTSAPGHAADVLRSSIWRQTGDDWQMVFHQGTPRPAKRIELNSLGYTTDLIFNQYEGTVVDRGDYIVATAGGNPNYFWGNLLIYKKPPVHGDLEKWKAAFKREITHPATYHITFGWASPTGELGSAEDFIQDGFTLAQCSVLTATSVKKAPKFNPKVTVRPISSAADFEAVIRTQVACASDDMSKATWEEFYRKQMALYRRMISDGHGHWFGAFLNGELVGSLGIFTDGELGRYQIVSTHPDHQRKGVCGTLVFESATYAFQTMKLKTLVMIAYENYHAAKIYESVGFVPTEKMVGVSWHDKSKV